MVPGSLPNPISFDQYYYCCFLRDGDQKTSVDSQTDVTVTTEADSNTSLTQDDSVTIPMFEKVQLQRWKDIGYKVLSLICHALGGLIHAQSTYRKDSVRE